MITEESLDAGVVVIGSLTEICCKLTVYLFGVYITLNLLDLRGEDGVIRYSK